MEPGQEVVICDPIYARLVNRIRLAGGIPRHVRSPSGERYLRLVFANEPVERLSDLRARFDTAFG